jgi:3-oxoadipate enol-lactonase
MPTVGRLRYLEALPQGGSRTNSSSRSARTLVLIHAFPLNARMWEPQLALAEHGWRIIAPQLRGMDQTSPRGSTQATPGPAAAADGREGGSGIAKATARGREGDSGNAPETTSIDDYAGDVIDLLDALHIEDAVIGGLSMGGYVTMAMFRHAPRYFRGMLLADTRSQADTPEGTEGRKRMLALLRAKGSRAVLEEMLPKLLGDTTRRERPAIADRLHELVLSNSEAAIAGAIAALMTRPDSTPVLSSIHCPTLVLVGDEDTLTPPQLSEDMHHAIAGSELVKIPVAGHLSSLERPEAFNAALGTFLTHRV